MYQIPLPLQPLVAPRFSELACDTAGFAGCPHAANIPRDNSRTLAHRLRLRLFDINIDHCAVFRHAMDSTTSESADSTADTPKPQPSILTLNNDVLLLIYDTLAADEDNIVPRPPIHDPSPLKQFSATCKRLRALYSSLVFRNLKLGGYNWDWTDIHHAVIQMLASQSVQRHTRRLSVDIFTNHEWAPSPEFAELL